MTDAELKRARKAYDGQRNGAKKRGIDWQFTFETWLQWWLDNGHWHERGCRKGQYCMCRYGDKGPYSPDNVYCDLHSKNAALPQIGRVPDADTRKRISNNHSSPLAKKVNIDGIIYDTIGDAARALNRARSGISVHLKRGTPGYEYI